jgi:hypothetical protein
VKESLKIGEGFLSYTKEFDGIVKKIETTAYVISEERGVEVTGIWDTGATNSCISKEIVEALGLKQFGESTVSSIEGKVPVHTYIVDIQLPNRNRLPDVEVACTELLDGELAMLIGMDVIKNCDFSISNVGGKTTLSIRTPSKGNLDFCK